MSIESISEFLKQHKGSWFNTNKIAEMTDASTSCTSRSLRKLRENYPEDINWRNDIRHPNWYEYTSKL